MSQSFIDAAHVDETTRDLRGLAHHTRILTEFYTKSKRNRIFFTDRRESLLFDCLFHAHEIQVD